VQVRYRYRIEPDEGQRSMLARTFGCCRVVFNDALRVRRDAREAREKISPTEVQRRVVTEAKTREERAWLAGVASVALVQSVRDADRAYRNFFDSYAERRKGRRVGHPRFKSRKDNRQSFRLTRNGFSLRPEGRLYVAKVGDLKVRWSRDLPSEPSSVTLGPVRSTHRGEGRTPRPCRPQGLPVAAQLQDLLDLRTRDGPHAVESPGVDVSGLLHGPRPRPQRGTRHPRRRAGGEPKRLWSPGKTSL
jgi:hypothetical protein